MKLSVFTLVLDGMPFLPTQFFTLSRLAFDIDWTWYIAHGAAANTGTTKWCRRQEPRLSRDGTTEFLASIKSHPRVRIVEREWWPGGKDQMVQACLDQISDPCVLMQIDADEIWECGQIEQIVDSFSNNPALGSMQFDCVYYVGQNIVAVTPGAYGNRNGEWTRAWRFWPGLMMTHEPPVLRGMPQGMLTMLNDATRAAGLVFHHFSYVFESQVAYKGAFYGYDDAVFHWQRLQNHKGPWPVYLKHYLHWVTDDSMADLLHK